MGPVGRATEHHFSVAHWAEAPRSSALKTRRLFSHHGAQDRCGVPEGSCQWSETCSPAPAPLEPDGRSRAVPAGGEDLLTLLDQNVGPRPQQAESSSGPQTCVERLLSIGCWLLGNKQDKGPSQGDVTGSSRVEAPTLRMRLSREQRPGRRGITQVFREEASRRASRPPESSFLTDE